MDDPYYRVLTVERQPLRSGQSAWRISFSRVGAPDGKIDVTVHSAIFAGLDLDAIFSAKDLMRLRQPSTS
jgi:hypothetical protein